VGSVLALTMWTLNLHEKPKVDKDLVGHPVLAFTAAHVSLIPASLATTANQGLSTEHCALHAEEIHLA